MQSARTIGRCISQLRRASEAGPAPETQGSPDYTSLGALVVCGIAHPRIPRRDTVSGRAALCRAALPG
jgi:hypothetical protein